MRKIIWILIFCFTIAIGYKAEAEEENYSYFYGPQGEIKGIETYDYIYDKMGELIAYKVRDDKHVYIYSPDGNRIGYKPLLKGRPNDEYLYDAEGNIIGYTDPDTLKRWYQSERKLGE